MTMPHERMRSLRWGAELLSELVADTAIPTELSQRAAALSSAYPAMSDLSGLISTNAARVPDSFAQAIEQARALFTEVQISCLGSAETRRSVLFTLRHFPLPGSAGRIRDVAAWLSLED